MNEFFATNSITILIIVNIILAIMLILNHNRIKVLEGLIKFTFKKIDLIDASLMYVDYNNDLMSLNNYILNIFARVQPEERKIAYHLLFRSNISAEQLYNVIKNNDIDNKYSADYKKYINNAENFYKG